MKKMALTSRCSGQFLCLTGECNKTRQMCPSTHNAPGPLCNPPTAGLGNSNQSPRWLGVGEKGATCRHVLRSVGHTHAPTTIFTQPMRSIDCFFVFFFFVWLYWETMTMLNTTYVITFVIKQWNSYNNKNQSAELYFSLPPPIHPP